MFLWLNSKHQNQHLSLWAALQQFMLLLSLWSSDVVPLHHLVDSPVQSQLRRVCLSCVSSVCSLRFVVHHDLAFPVEGVGHHAGQLSSSLHNQVPEAQVFTSELLQAFLMSQTWITAFVFVVLEPFQHFFYSLILSDGQVTCGGQKPLEQRETERNQTTLLWILHWNLGMTWKTRAHRKRQ